MLDPLFDRAQFAIEESSVLRAYRRALIEQRRRELSELRYAVLHCAMMRVESRAYREDRLGEPTMERGPSPFRAYRTPKLGAWPIDWTGKP
jgi:hypothetical protein